MKTIHKFPLILPEPGTHVVKVQMPRWSTVLSCGLDPAGVLCVWAAVDDTAEPTVFGFHVVGTGHDIDGITLGQFLATVKLSGKYEGLVVHVFDMQRRAK